MPTFRNGALDSGDIVPGSSSMHFASSRRLRAAAAGAIALALVLTGCSSDETYSYTPPAQPEGALSEGTVAQLDAAIAHGMAAAGASGAIVGIWAPWSGSYVAGVGNQGDGETPVSADMTFRIADTTRIMTCDVLYGLVDDGVVELDAPVPEYVSGVADMEEVTLLDLCNGTSGASSSEGTVRDLWLKTPERQWGALELASYGLGKARGPLHTTFVDSDSGYLLLGLALERASGKSAAALISEYVTTPLGLANTSLPSAAAQAPGENPLSGHFLTPIEGGYECTAPVDITTSSASIGFTDSGVVSTIDDLGRYVQAAARDGLRPEGSEPARFTNPLPASPQSPSWHQASGGAYLVGSMVGQNGWVPGYATAAFSDPASGFTVAIVLNNSTAGSDLVRNLAWELAAIASKEPAAEGQTPPDFALPFTAEQFHASVAAGAVCAQPVAE